MTTDPAHTLSPALAAIAERLHGLPGEAHRVVSPLGVWLLLARVARAAEGETGDLDVALGMPRARAVELADRLVGSPHPVVLDAFAAWVREEWRTDAVRAFFDALPGDVTSGTMPTQREADAWASEKTDGLITEYPLSLGSGVLITLANALATRVGWIEPFRTVPAGGSDGLGAGPFAGAVTRALVAAPGVGHGAWLASSPIGPVAVHVARAEGLDVWSVIADPAAQPREVLRTAYALVAGNAPPLPLSSLPLGDGPAWTIEEIRATASPAERRTGRVASVTVPAWSARATLDLTADPALGFPAAGDVLGALLGRPGLELLAVQSAVARYHRVGFEAAAVTAIAMRTSAVIHEEGPLRVARLRFGHPYAAVAVARPTPGRGGGEDPWDGIPVFSAWVAAAEEPQD